MGQPRVDDDVVAVPVRGTVVLTAARDEPQSRVVDGPENP